MIRQLPRLLLVFIFLSALPASGCSPNKKFSVAAWQKASPNDRRLIAEDFLRSIHTGGMSFDEIKVLLGEPDYPQNSLIYYVSDDPSALESVDSGYRNVMYVAIDNGIVDYVSLPRNFGPKGEIPFDSALWKNSRPADRARMATSLRDSDILANKPASQVEAVLGKANEQEINYDLGINVVAEVTLTFLLDQNDQVLSAEVVEH